MKVNKLTYVLLAMGLLTTFGILAHAQRVDRQLLIDRRVETTVQSKSASSSIEKPDVETKRLQAEVPTDKKAIIGSWIETVTFSGSDPMPPLRSLVTFAADGNVLVADQGAVGPASAFSAGHGTWVHSGGRSFEWTTVELIYSTTDGELIGYLKVSGRYSVNESGNSYAGEFHATVSAPDGTVLFTAQGTNAGTRILVEPTI